MCDSPPKKDQKGSKRRNLVKLNPSNPNYSNLFSRCSYMFHLFHSVRAFLLPCELASGLGEPAWLIRKRPCPMGMPCLYLSFSWACSHHRITNPWGVSCPYPVCLKYLFLPCWVHKLITYSDLVTYYGRGSANEVIKTIGEGQRPRWDCLCQRGN